MTLLAILLTIIGLSRILQILSVDNDTLKDAIKTYNFPVEVDPNVVKWTTIAIGAIETVCGFYIVF